MKNLTERSKQPDARPKLRLRDRVETYAKPLSSQVKPAETAVFSA